MQEEEDSRRNNGSIIGRTMDYSRWTPKRLDLGDISPPLNLLRFSFSDPAPYSDFTSTRFLSRDEKISHGSDVHLASKQTEIKTAEVAATPRRGMRLTKCNIVLDVQSLFLRVWVVPSCILQLRLCPLISIILMLGLHNTYCQD